MIKKYKYSFIAFIIALATLIFQSLSVFMFAIFVAILVFIAEWYTHKTIKDFDKMCKQWVRDSQFTAEQMVNETIQKIEANNNANI